MRLRGAAAALLALAAVAGACGAPSCPDELPATCCLLDGGQRHAVAPLGCADDDECPSGTYCAALPATCAPGDPCCRPAGGRCVVGSALRTDALLRGWAVPAAPVAKVASDTGAALAWQAPPGALVARCAVFQCNPVLREACGGGVRVVNHDRCVVAERTMSATEHLELSDPTLAFSAARDPDCARAQRAFPSLLAAGCWFYDETSLVAATELVPLRLAEVAHDAAFTEACGASADSVLAACELPASEGGGLGTCTPAGRCARRCMDDCDCAEGGAATVCEREPTAWVGHCGDVASTEGC